MSYNCGDARSIVGCDDCRSGIHLCFSCIHRKRFPSCPAKQEDKKFGCHEGLNNVIKCNCYRTTANNEFE